MYKPSLYARWFYDLETLKLLEMLYRDSTTIRSWKSGYSTVYEVSVYGDDGQKSVEITFYTDGWRMVIEFFRDGRGATETLYSECPLPFYRHVKSLYDNWTNHAERQREKANRLKVEKALQSVDLSAKRLTVDKS